MLSVIFETDGVIDNDAGDFDYLHDCQSGKLWGKQTAQLRYIFRLHWILCAVPAQGVTLNGKSYAPQPR